MLPSLVGYCNYKEHKGFIAVSIMNAYECIAKECHYFEKFESYPFLQKFYRREQAEKIKKSHEKKERKQETTFSRYK